METQMLRYTLNKLEKLGYTKTCSKKVDKDYELGAVLRYFDNEVPIIFDNVKGYDISLVGGLYGNRQIFYDL
ncbi:MAG: UbiD family decarboxylase, partial [Peptostreptococcaceae bacterium]